MRAVVITVSSCLLLAQAALAWSAAPVAGEVPSDVLADAVFLRLPQPDGQPEEPAPIAAEPSKAMPRETAAPRGVSLASFEEIAISSHPSILALAAQVKAARCKRYQAGLPPNPTVGYLASEIGNEGNAGQQGVFVGQRFIRGNKLGLDQAVICHEIRQLEQQLAAQHLRVLTIVRTTFFNAYLAQREVELSEQLVEVSRQAADSVKQLLDAQEARRTDVLQAEIESQRIAARLLQATYTWDAAWRRLAAAVGQPAMAKRRIMADPATIHWAQGWEETRQSLLAGSPQIAAAVIEVSRAKAAWRRARAEPIPDVNAQVSMQYDDSTTDTVAGVQVGVSLPIWNRNQGRIGQACHGVTAAQRRLESLELSLTQQLAMRMQQYQGAEARSDAFRTGILDRAEENMELVQQAYEAGEATYLDLLTVQRTFFESNLDYLAALREVNTSVQLLGGFLLGGEEG